MLNIHLKIEAKETCLITLAQLSELTNKKQSETLKSLYITFSKDCFILPYKVQKLSKRARRNLI